MFWEDVSLLYTTDLYITGLYTTDSYTTDLYTTDSYTTDLYILLCFQDFVNKPNDNCLSHYVKFR